MKTPCPEEPGVALMPDFFVQPELRHGALVPVLGIGNRRRDASRCAFKRQRYSRAKLRDFIYLMARSVMNIDSFNLYVGGGLLRQP